jgi:hypothetical protein
MAKILSQYIDPAGYVRCLVEVDKTEATEFKFRKHEDIEVRCDEELAKLVAMRAEAVKPQVREKVRTLDGTVYYADELQPVRATEVTKAVRLDTGDRIAAVVAVEERIR